MAERFSALEDKHIEFIGEQQMFFVGTAAAKGRVNVSPKGMDTFRVLSPTEVAWLNLTGSGNESAAHVLDNPRMTVMFCSFDKQPLIMRLYGKAEVVHSRDAKWPALLALFPEDVGARQVFRLQLELVLTSCGYGVPRYELLGERPTLKKWSQKHGREGIEQYWRDKNVTSLDGSNTGILGDTD